MYFIDSWKNSVQLLKPTNLKLFLLVALKSIGTTYKTVALYWSWLLVFLYSGIIPMIYNKILTYFALTPYKDSVLIFVAIELILRLLLLFGICLAARPSMHQKRLAYFVGYWKHFLALLLLIGILGGGMIGIVRLGDQFLFPYMIFKHIMIFPLGCILQVLLWGAFACGGIGIVFAILFLLDSPSGSFSLFTAVRGMLFMLFYNLPICALVALLFSGIYLGVAWLTIFGRCNSFFDIMMSILQPVPIVVYTNLYIKWVHEQSRFYYWQPS